MRETFRQDLALLDERLYSMSRLVGASIANAMQSVVSVDLVLAEGVIEADREIDRIEQQIDEQAVQMLARQSPVATDLRVLVTSLRLSSALERMGDLARHVAQLAQLRFPHPALPDDVRPLLAEMAALDEGLAHRVGKLIRCRDLKVAEQIVNADVRVDELHREVFRMLADARWQHDTQTTVDTTLCSRYLERFGDHAVSVAHRMEFLVRGEHSAARHARVSL